MATRGRKPKPPELKILAGTRPDRIPADAPAALKGRPACPDHLDVIARQEWDRIVPELEELGVLSRTDGAALVLYCSTYSRWRSALDEIKAKGLLVPAKVGVRVNPAVAIAASCEAQMARMLAEFGCTPSSRSRVVGSRPAKPADKFASLMAKKKG